MVNDFKNSRNFDDVFCDLYADETDIADYLTTAFNSYVIDGNFGAFYRSLEMSAKAKKINLNDYDINTQNEPSIPTLKKVFNALGVDLTLKSA